MDRSHPDEVFLHFLLEQMDELAALVGDADEVTHVSVSLARLLHQARGAVAGTPFPDTLVAEERRRAQRFLADARDRGEAGPITLRHGPAAVEVEWRGFHAGSRRLVLLGSFTARAAQRPVGERSRGSSLRHQVSNPLTAIMGLAELALVEDPALDGSTAERLRVILDNCERIAGALRAEERAADPRPPRDIAPGAETS